MTCPRFVQIHALASFPGALLNRDDAGLAKRLPFGGAERTRVSSQALKRRWRFAGEADHEAAKRSSHALQNLGMPMGERSKEVIERAVMPQATASMPALHPAALAVVRDALVVALYGEKAADPKNRQALFFGQPEIAYVQKIGRELIEQAVSHEALLAASGKEPDKKALKALDDVLKEMLKPLQKNLRALADTTRGAAGLESALFGRMVTSDTAANVQAAVHVAHAFTVHAMERELDYVTAVDDLRSRGADADAGSAGIFDIELTSGLFYIYVSVDVPLLIANLDGDATLAGQVVDRLIQLIARTSPGAKKGSTAPYAHAEFILVETGDDQPRTLANAFRRPVPLRGDVFENTMQALAAHLSNLDRAYGVHTERLQLSVTPPSLAGVSSADLASLCNTVRSRIEAA